MKQIKAIADTMSYSISTRLLMEQALRRDYAITYFPSSPSTRSGITHCVKDGREFFFKSTCAALNPAYGVFAAENKYLTYSMLSGYGIPAPETVTVSPDGKFEDALDLLQKYHCVVIKPAATNHGDGVTVGVTNLSELKKAITFAHKAGGGKMDVVIQQQVAGKEYRFLVVAGKVVAVAHRRPPFVTGNGKATIRVLIEAKNKDPRRGLEHASELTLISLEEVSHHKGAAFLRRILPMGEEVAVLDTSNLSKGGEAIDLTDEVSSALKKMAVAAAEGCFLKIAGVDIITNDITADTWDGSFVLEVNLTPGLRMHQFPTLGQPRDVAKIVFDAIEETAQPIGAHPQPIGSAERIAFPELELAQVPARIDTGARTSTIWASKAVIYGEKLEVTLFDPSSEHYTGKVITFDSFERIVVASSNGQTQMRYKVRLLVRIKGRKIRAWFTLADRSRQVYPVLIGRNVLLGKFIVDLRKGRSLKAAERQRIETLQSKLDEA